MSYFLCLPGQAAEPGAAYPKEVTACAAEGGPGGGPGGGAGTGGEGQTSAGHF